MEIKRDMSSIDDDRSALPHARAMFAREMIEEGINLYIQSFLITLGGRVDELQRNKKHYQDYYHNVESVRPDPLFSIEDSFLLKKVELEKYFEECKNDMNQIMNEFFDGLVERCPETKKDELREYINSKRNNFDLDNPDLMSEVKRIIAHAIRIAADLV